MPHWRRASVFRAGSCCLEADDVGVVDGPVDHGRGDSQVPEDVAPRGRSGGCASGSSSVLVEAGDERLALPNEGNLVAALERAEPDPNAQTFTGDA